MAADAVRFRLLYDGVPPRSCVGHPCVFGLQNTKQEIFEGRPLDSELLAYDFELRVKPGPDPDHPVFLGEFASGPPSDRFVYLSWRSQQTGVYVARKKARLSPITWAMVRDAQARDLPITASMVVRQTGKGKPPEWRAG